jgi:hypothetical protein
MKPEILHDVLTQPCVIVLSHSIDVVVACLMLVLVIEMLLNLCIDTSQVV